MARKRSKGATETGSIPIAAESAVTVASLDTEEEHASTERVLTPQMTMSLTGIDTVYGEGTAAFTRRKVLITIVVVGLCMLLAYVVRTHRAAPVSVTQREAINAALVAEVGKLMLLPNEKPMVYRVDDPAVLVADQPFFNGVQKGDVLLVFPNAAKAVVYSEKRRIIINAGPVTFSTHDIQTTKALR